MCSMNLFSYFVYLNCCEISKLHIHLACPEIRNRFGIILLQLFFYGSDLAQVLSVFFFFTPSFRWKVHDDWVSQLKYYDSLRAVISCSNHPDTALVIGKLCYYCR